MENGRTLGDRIWMFIACRLVKSRTFPVFLVGILALAGFGAAALGGTSGGPNPAHSQVAATAATGNPSFAGHWLFQFFAFCYESDVALCDQTNTEVQGAYTQITTIIADSDAQGRFTFQDDRMITDNTRATSPQCNGRFFSGPPMSGFCQMTGHGTGYFAPANGTLLPVLWITDEWVTFQSQSGAQLVHNPVRYQLPDSMASTWNGPYPQALPIPAVPGSYDNAALGAVFGGSPAGDLSDEIDHVVVTRY